MKSSLILSLEFEPNISLRLSAETLVLAELDHTHCIQRLSQNSREMAGDNVI